MKISKGGQPAFQLSPVAVGCAVFLALAGAQASAQTQAADGVQAAPVNTVTVTGIRRSIEDAIAVKRDATSIVETISAEDIGKLPDISIAESLARLPGLSAQRVNGQAQQISIRGTSGDLSTALLNGREQVSTSANRTVEYDQYPSELINAVTVYKTSDASLVGQGLSGTVNLQTIKPLSLRERVVTLNVRGEKNSQGKLSTGSKDKGSRISASYVDQFLGRTLGVAVGYARADQAERVEAIRDLGLGRQYVVRAGQDRQGSERHQVAGADRQPGARRPDGRRGMAPDPRIHVDDRRVPLALQAR